MAYNNPRKIKRKVRNAYMISTVSIALVLFLLGAVGYLIVGALNASNRLKENVSVFVMLTDEITPECSASVKQKLTAMPTLKEVTFISKDVAADSFKAYLGHDFEDFLQTNPLPDAYEVKLEGHASDPQTLAALEKQLMTWEGVDEVVYQRNVMEQISSNINKFNLVLLFFGGALFVISLILLNNKIRVMIFSKRYIINTMKLVGATRWFIMRPFLGHSILQGVYAGLIAWIMLALMIMGLHEGLPEMQFISEQTPLLILFGSMMGGGILISLLFTAFAVRKFLRMRSGDIYLY
ncbi:MAG: permease-like cell division protein FtsX [Alistipes sp.]|nr:permease-like cell division protein FtsX [Alistipes sp.]